MLESAVIVTADAYWTAFWGKELPKHSVQLPPVEISAMDEDGDVEMASFESDEREIFGTIHTGDLLPGSEPFYGPLVSRRNDGFLVRADYLRVYDAIEEFIKERTTGYPHAVVVTGQPGIGESSFFHPYFPTHLLRKVNLDSIRHPAPTRLEASHYFVR